MSEQITGKISQIIGAVVDVSFEDEGHLPKIFDALKVRRPNGDVLVLECQQDIGENTIRTIAMDSTDGLKRGMLVYGDGNQISMPTGEDIKGRLFNVIGDTIDGIPPVKGEPATIFTVIRLPLKT
jgi:F-type H+-transporting ATPase subunit beta